MALRNNLEVSTVEKLSINLTLREHETVLTDYVRHYFLRSRRVDLIFLCDENREVGTHKLLFILASKFMKEILQTPEEAVYISVTDFKESTFRILLKVLLTGSASVTYEDFHNLKSLISVLGISSLDQIIQSSTNSVQYDNETGDSPVYEHDYVEVSPESEWINSWDSSEVCDKRVNESSHVSVDTLHLFSGEDVEENLDEEVNGYSNNNEFSDGSHERDPLEHTSSDSLTNSESNMGINVDNVVVSDYHSNQRNRNHVGMEIASADEPCMKQSKAKNTVNGNKTGHSLKNSSSSVTLQAVNSVQNGDTEDQNESENISEMGNFEEIVLPLHATNGEEKNLSPSFDSPIECYKREQEDNTFIEATDYSLRNCGNEEHESNKTSPAKKRIKLTEEQSLILTNTFKANTYITPQERRKLARRLSLPDQSVKVWFNNYRQIFKTDSKKKLKLKKRQVLNTSYKKTYLTSTRGQHQYANKIGESKITVKEFLQKKRSMEKEECTVVLRPLKNIQKENRGYVDDSNNVVQNERFCDESICEEETNIPLVRTLPLCENGISEGFEDSNTNLDSPTTSTTEPHNNNSDTGQASNIQNYEVYCNKQRMSVSTEQAHILEKSFGNEKYPSLAARKILARRLGMREDAVKNWFNNKRSKLKKGTRVKGKKIKKKLKGIRRKKSQKFVIPTSMKCRSAHQAVTEELKDLLAETAAEWFGDRARSPKKSGSGIPDLSEFIKEEVVEETSTANEKEINVPEVSSTCKRASKRETNMEMRKGSHVRQLSEFVKKEIVDDDDEVSTGSATRIEAYRMKNSTTRKSVLRNDANKNTFKDSSIPHLSASINKESQEGSMVQESFAAAEVDDTEEGIACDSLSRKKTRSETKDSEVSLPANSIKKEIEEEQSTSGSDTVKKTRVVKKSAANGSVSGKDTNIETVQDSEVPLLSCSIKSEVEEEQMTSESVDATKSRAARKSAVYESISRKTNAKAVKGNERISKNNSIAKRGIKFTDEQRKILEEYFKEEPYPSLEAKSKLAKQFERSAVSISIWFENRRRGMKNGKRRKMQNSAGLQKKHIYLSLRQKKILEKSFKKNSRPSAEDEEKLALTLGVSEVIVHNWIKGKRSKEKRGVGSKITKSHHASKQVRTNIKIEDIKKERR